MDHLDFQEQYQSAVINVLSQGILLIDTNGMIAVYNLEAKSILKKEAEQVLFKKFDTIFPDMLFGFSVNQALKEHVTPGIIHHSIQLSDLSSVELEIESYAIPEGIVISFRNCSDIEQIESNEQRENRINNLGEIASIVAHEIRNPLGGIKGFASLLKRDLKNQPNLEKMAALILKGTESLDHVVTQILDYVRPLKIEPKKEDLVPLLHDIKEHLLSDPQFNKDTTVVFECEEKRLSINIDNRALRSALLNLFINASQAMPDGGQITLLLKKGPNHAIIVVSDTGIGIPPENMRKIYSPFFTTKPNGNGLGLAEVKKVIQAHNGFLHIESKVNKGTIFTIKLPLNRQGSRG